MKNIGLLSFSSMSYVCSLIFDCNFRLKNKELQAIKNEYYSLEYNFRILQEFMKLDNIKKYTPINQNTAAEIFIHINDEIELFRQIDLKFDRIKEALLIFKIYLKSKKSILKEILQHNCRMIESFQKSIQIENLSLYKNLSFEIRNDLVILVLQYKRNIFDIINITNRIYDYFQDIIEVL